MSSLAMTVDDADDLRALVRTVLESNDFDVIEAASGRAALDLLAAIRAEPGTAEVAVVLCTVRAAQADIEHGWRLGCDGFLPKPFAIDELARTVVEVSNRTSDQRAALRAEHQIETP